MIQNLGIGGGFGTALGVFLVWWVGPTSSGGTGLLLFSCIVACTTLGGLVSLLLRKNSEAKR
jgi:hypothetical protein